MHYRYNVCIIYTCIIHTPKLIKYMQDLYEEKCKTLLRYINKT